MTKARFRAAPATAAIAVSAALIIAAPAAAAPAPAETIGGPVETGGLFDGAFKEPVGSILSHVVEEPDAFAARSETAPAPTAIPLPDGVWMLLFAFGCFGLAGWRARRGRA